MYIYTYTHFWKFLYMFSTWKLLSPLGWTPVLLPFFKEGTKSRRESRGEVRKDWGRELSKNFSVCSLFTLAEKRRKVLVLYFPFYSDWLNYKENNHTYFMFYVSTSIHLNASGCIQHSQMSPIRIAAHKHIPLILASISAAATKGLDLLKISLLF